jgi:hypothetical protein
MKRLSRPGSATTASTGSQRLRAISVPRLGPPSNLRPAGAHKNKKHLTRSVKKLDVRRMEAE